MRKWNVHVQHVSVLDLQSKLADWPIGDYIANLLLNPLMGTGLYVGSYEM